MASIIRRNKPRRDHFYVTSRTLSLYSRAEWIMRCPCNLSDYDLRYPLYSGMAILNCIFRPHCDRLSILQEHIGVVQKVLTTFHYANVALKLKNADSLPKLENLRHKTGPRVLLISSHTTEAINNLKKFSISQNCDPSRELSYVLNISFQTLYV